MVLNIQASNKYTLHASQVFQDNNIFFIMINIMISSHHCNWYKFDDQFIDPLLDVITGVLLVDIDVS